MAQIIKEKIKFLKIRDVLSPIRAFETDAGIDFFVPKFNKDFVDSFKGKNEDFFKDDNCCCKFNATLSTSSTTTFQINNNMASPAVSYDVNDINKSIFKYDEEKGKLYFILNPHSKVNIPSGIKVRMNSPNRALIAANKSGIASKHGLVFGAQVVDYSYTGEVHINVINTSTKIVKIYEDMKLIQFVETPIFTSEIEMTSDPAGFYKDFMTSKDKNRGSGGFGHTNNTQQLNS